MGPNFATLKAVLIDLDGTLVDSLPTLYETFRIFMEDYGHVGSFEEFCALSGPSLLEIMTVLNQKYQMEQETAQLIHRYQLILIKKYDERLQLFPQAREFLIYAKTRELKLGLVTSAPLAVVQRFIEAQNLGCYFDRIVTPEGLKKSKPSPEIYERALSLLGVKNNESLAIEDSPNGVEAAVSASIPTIQLLHENLEPVQRNPKNVLTVDSWASIIHLFRTYDE